MNDLIIYVNRIMNDLIIYVNFETKTILVKAPKMR